MIIDDYEVAASIIALISFVGATCNCFVCITIQRLPRMANPFGRISGILAAFEALTLALFLFYFVPAVFFDIKVLKVNSYYCGACLIGCFQFVVYAHVLISLNRFCAIFFPFYYGKVFTKYTTTAFIILIWLVAATTSVFTYILGSCRFKYFDDYWRFGFEYTAKCPSIPFPTNGEGFSTCLFLIIVLDFIAIYRVRMYNKGIAKSHNLNKCWSSKRKNEEVNFLKQACLRAVLFTSGIIIYYVLPYYFENRWIKFMFGPVTWVSILTADGLLIIIYNRDFRSSFKRKTTQPQNKVVTAYF